jgi:hypothetical protein
MVELGMEVEETERFWSVLLRITERSTSSSAPAPWYTTTYPIPANQPTRYSSTNSLISPRNPQADFVPLLPIPTNHYRGTLTRSTLLADDGSQRNFYFANDGLGLNDKWRKINVVLPMPALTPENQGRRPQAEFEGPFLRIKHDLKIKVVCRNANEVHHTVSPSTLLKTLANSIVI